MDEYIAKNGDDKQFIETKPYFESKNNIISPNWNHSNKS